MRHAAIILAIASTVLTGCNDGPLLEAPLGPQPTSPSFDRSDRRLPKDFFVAPDGRATGDGTRARPWGLAAALSGAQGALLPGDNVWLRGGVYRGKFTSELTGLPAKPITVGQYPGERATIDGGLYVHGAHVTFRDFEIMQSNPLDTPKLNALETHANGERYINLVIHDAGRQGVTFGRGSGYSEIYGCVIYNNGTREALDHGMYVTNDDGAKWVTNNVVFNNMAYGIHVYATASENHKLLTDVRVTGNVSFNNGAISSDGPTKSNLLIGGDVPTQDVSAVRNVLYFSPSVTGGQNLRLGLPPDKDHLLRANRNVIAQNNYVVGGHTVLRIENWQDARVYQNTLVGTQRMVRLGGALGGFRWSSNVSHRDPVTESWKYAAKDYTHAGFKGVTGFTTGEVAYAAGPKQTKVIVRKNKYEYGRASIAILNWARQPSVSVDVSDVLRKGDHFEVHNVQDYYGKPVASGVYRGGPLLLPMTGVAPPAALGRPRAPMATSPDFDVFVLTTREGRRAPRDMRHAP